MCSRLCDSYLERIYQIGLLLMGWSWDSGVTPFQGLVMRVRPFLLHVHPTKVSWGARPARTPRRAAGGMVSVRVQVRGQG